MERFNELLIEVASQYQQLSEEEKSQYGIFFTLSDGEKASNIVAGSDELIMHSILEVCSQSEDIADAIITVAHILTSDNCECSNCDCDDCKCDKTYLS